MRLAFDPEGYTLTLGVTSSRRKGGPLMSRFVTIAVGVAITCLALTPPAQALNTRTWISGSGLDQAGCGPIANPCRTLQYAHDNTSAGGEIDVKDPAGYGSLFIHKAINIVADGVGVAGVLAPANGNGITVNVGANENVVLRGLTIEGAGIADNGIVFANGGSLSIVNCAVQGFATSGNGNGILVINNTAKFDIAVLNSTLSDNKSYGLRFTAQNNTTGRLTIDHSSAIRNNVGFSFETRATTANLYLAMSDSNAANNTLDGVQVYANALTVSAVFDHVLANNNGSYVNNANNGNGFTVTNPQAFAQFVAFTRCVAYNNYGYGFTGNIGSYGDNRFGTLGGSITAINSQ